MFRLPRRLTGLGNRVLSWQLSITMEAAFCVETLEDALARHGKPEIFNTDRGSQFTGSVFTCLLTNNGIALSAWTARGRNTEIRLRRSVRHSSLTRFLRWPSVGIAKEF